MSLPLPPQYADLANEPGPKMLKSALYYYGLHEAPGGADNPTIMAWAQELGLREYNADSVPWCGLAMAKFARDAGKPFPEHPLWAQNWLKFGTPVPQAMLGDVLVFHRPGGGHVGLYVGEDADAYHVLGGNTGDAVSVARIARARLLGARRPPYNVQPDNVRVIKRSATGALSHNEG